MKPTPSGAKYILTFAVLFGVGTAILQLPNSPEIVQYEY
jgi:hypothetical protein